MQTFSQWLSVAILPENKHPTLTAPCSASEGENVWFYIHTSLKRKRRIIVYYQHYYHSLRLRFRLVISSKDFLRLRFRLVNYLFVAVVLVRLVLPRHT